MNFAEPVKTPLSGDVIPLTHAYSSSLTDPRRELDEGVMLEASRIAYPAVAARASRKDGLGLVAGGATALLLGAATFWSLSSGRDEKSLPVAAPTQSPAPTVSAVPPVELQFAPAEGTAATPGNSLVFTPAPQPLNLQGQGQVIPGSPSSPIADRLRSPSLIVDESGPVMPLNSGAVPALTVAPVAASPAASGDEFAARADASASDAATATRLADPANTVVQGTLIPAVLETAINTDLPGYARAVVTQDVRSFDGSRILIPRSSRLIGQYRSGLAAGQKRAYVLWSRLIRPDGASVAIASPATDGSGRTGLAGNVDSHFFQRFGSALLLSVVGAAGAVATGGASVLLSGGSNPATVATQQNGTIPPTIRVAQGHPIRVFTARDLNFAGVSGAAGR